MAPLSLVPMVVLTAVSSGMSRKRARHTLVSGEAANRQGVLEGRHFRRERLSSALNPAGYYA
jgi:hypothetical protein